MKVNVVDKGNKQLDLINCVEITETVQRIVFYGYGGVLELQYNGYSKGKVKL